MHDMEFFQPVLIITCFSQLIRITDITSHFCIFQNKFFTCSLCTPEGIIHSSNDIYCVKLIDFSPPLRTIAEHVLQFRIVW